MVTVPPVIQENPLPVVLSVGAAVVGVATVGVALTGGRLRLVIRLAALAVVLAVFAGWFWMNVVGERMG